MSSDVIVCERCCLVDIMGINKLTALEVEKQEARKNYTAAKADYERVNCGFPFERLHVNKTIAR
jgi:energy-converting hydrogenase A subunit M